jgi:hypothetical protein
MTLLTQLLSPQHLLTLNEDQLDTVYAVVEAEVLKNPEFMSFLSKKIQSEFVPTFESFTRS